MGMYDGTDYQDDPWQQQAMNQPPPKPPAPPAPPEPPKEPAAATKNRYGGSANLDSDYLLGQIRSDAQKQGLSLTPEREQYWLGKASNPDLYSDNQWRVGWNPYWASKLGGAVSSDPSLAGSEGVLQGYGGGQGAGAGPAAGPAQPASSPFQDQVRQLLMKTMQDNSKPVDENSAEIQQPFNAASMQAQRGFEGERKALAERLYAEGGGSGTNELTHGLQQSSERMAGGLASVKAQLYQRAIEQRQSQLRSALSLAVQSGDAESARAIQMQLAQMDQSRWNDQYGLLLNDALYKRNNDGAAAKTGG